MAPYPGIKKYDVLQFNAKYLLILIPILYYPGLFIIYAISRKLRVNMKYNWTKKGMAVIFFC